MQGMQGMQGMPMNSAAMDMPMQGMQGMPMNSAAMDMPMQGMQGMPMNSAAMDMPMNGMPMNGMQGMPMNGMQGMPMQGMSGMNGMQGMPMQGMSGMNGMQGITQQQADNIIQKYGPGYSGPVDMVGGGQLVDLEFTLNDNLSSGQKKKTKLKKNERANQTGGSGRIIPKYMGTKNTPFKPQETKNIETSRRKEIPQYNNNPVKSDPLVEFKLSQSIMGPGARPMNQSMYPSAYVPVQNQYLPENYPYVTGSGMHNMNPYSFVPNNVPVIKNYHISMPNPAGDHVKLADIYEDMLPNDNTKYKNTSLTLEERLVTYNYVRSILVRIGDGEDIDISGKIKDSVNRKNLLSYLKLLDLNPYHNSKLSANPYMDLPDRMIMYRSCYPIRFDPAKSRVTCSKYSIGLNLRIYDMSIAEYNVKNLFFNENDNNVDVNPMEFNIWREVAFYEFVREEILKKKMCPNFPMLYSWFISTGSDIDFEKLRLIKNKYGQEISKADIKTANRINNKYRNAVNEHLKSIKQPFGVDSTSLPVQKKVNKFVNITNPIGFIGPYPVLPKNGPIPEMNVNLQFTPDTNKLNRNKEVSIFDTKSNRGQIDLNKSVNRNLLALTEAPNYNIRQWATKTYENQELGPVKKMIQTGYHHADVWLSIIFQLLISLQVMYIKRFTFIDMTLEDNVYIKDLMNNEQVMGYWKYIFDGFEYYIPNHGYLLMIDSNFRDIKNSNHNVLLKSNKDDQSYKMYGVVAGQKFEEYDTTGNKTPAGNKLDEIQYSNIQKLLDPNNFNNIHTNYGGVKPDQKVLSLLTQIKGDIDTKSSQDGDLSDIIKNYMGRFVHNRAGTPLSSTELENVNKSLPVTNPISGKLYAYNPRDELFAWVVYINTELGGQYKVLSRVNFRDVDDVVPIIIDPSQLFEYVSLVNIQQKYKPQEVKLSEDELLEIYKVN